jgi:hypothetical protein
VTTTIGCFETPLPCEMRGSATTFSIRSCEGYSADGAGFPPLEEIEVERCSCLT